ncbi:MAG: hypothetical protein CMI31_04610 [Opitutae bacterium]|nr:hypothetical protein [Opitutae bacterium]
MLAQQALACQVPVFRYALERWQADKYHAVIVHHAPLTAKQTKALELLDRAVNPSLGNGANLMLHKLDLASEPRVDPRWKGEASTFKPDDTPRIALYYPTSSKIREALWTGDLTLKNVEGIIDSPLRRKIKSELLSGTSNVWLLVESGNVAADRSAEARLKKFLEQTSRETKLPKGIIPLEQAGQLRSGPDEGPIDLDDVLRSSVPLKIQFTTLAVSRKDPAEEIFVSMLLNHSRRMRTQADQPIAIPIFGRGRVLEGMIGKDITLEHSRGAASYLCSACSCQVKEENPGLDMLMAVKWADHMLGNLIIEDKTLPPLEGIGEILRSRVRKKKQANKPKPIQPANPKPNKPVKPKPKPKAKANDIRRKTIPFTVPEVQLADKLQKIEMEGIQIDLPAATTDKKGRVLVAYLEWNGKSDALRLARTKAVGFEVLATVIDSAVLHAPALAVDGKGTTWVVWSETADDKSVNLKACSWNEKNGLGKPVTLADTDAAEAFAVSGTDSKGRVWVSWQSFRAGESDVYARVLDSKSGKWSKELAVATQKGGDWAPSMAFDEKGNAWIAYDSSRGNEFNLYLCRVDAEGKTKEFPIAHSNKYEARASLAATADGKGLWIAAERGKVKHGLDYRGHGNKTGINAEKSVLFGRFDIASSQFEEIPLGPAGEAGNPVNLPVVGVGREGNPWVAYRYFNAALWRVAVTSYRVKSGTWSSRRRIPSSSFGQDRKVVLLPNGKGTMGDLRACWPSDERKHKAHQTAKVMLAALPSPSKLPEASPVAPKKEQAENPPHSHKTPERPASDRHQWKVDGKSYGLFWGDVHRHTDVSNCRTGFDGCIVDHFRYAYDLAKLDFLGTSDHTDAGKMYHPYEWWHNQRMHDALHSPGRFNTLYVYEREQRWPWGHRNVVFAQRGGPIIYIKKSLYLNSPWQKTLPAKKGEGEILPYELWEMLKKYGKPVALISHTGATGMGTDWSKYEKFDYSSENIVEIYQGARVSYEGAGAPQPTVGLLPNTSLNSLGRVQNAPPEPIMDFGQYARGTYQNALKQGHNLGVFASSDHISQHASYGGVFCKEFTREGIIEAMDNRRTIAATDKIYLNFTCNGKPLGSIFETKENAKLWLKVDGTAPFRRITIVRNEKDWKNFGIFTGKTFEETVTDENMLEGENRYYVRVMQSDGNMAWSSPVWVTKKKP